MLTHDHKVRDASRFTYPELYSKEVDTWSRGCIHPEFLLKDVLWVKEAPYLRDTGKQQARADEVKV